MSIRRILALLLAVLLLTGCSAKKQRQDTEPVAEPSAQGLYVPASSAETATAGAVRQHQIDQMDGQRWMQTAGNLVRIDTTDGIKLTAYSGEELTPYAECTLEIGAMLENARTTNNGFAYYVP